MHKLVWNRMEFPIQEKREDCFRIQESLLPVFLLQHKYYVHTSMPTPRKKGESLNSDLLTVRHDGKKLLLQLGRFAMERFASQLCPSNHQMDICLNIWRGSFNHHVSFSFLFWDFIVELFPLAVTGSFLRDGTKMQHAFSVWGMFSPWPISSRWSSLNKMEGEGENVFIKNK